MANDFSGDASCVALYTMENDWPTSGTLDDEGPNNSNDLGHNGTIVRDGADFKEGSYSADLERSGSNEYFDLADGSLSNDFPGKNGTSNVDMSSCFWFKNESSSTDLTYASKYNSGGGARSWRFKLESTDDQFEFVLGYNGGASFIEADHGGTIVDGQWYHVGIIYDDDGGADSKGNIKIRIWDDNAGAILQSGGSDTHDEDMGQQMSVDTATFAIGAHFTPTTSGYYDGHLDELVIFGDLLSVAEIDEIRSGTYGASGSNIPIFMYHYLNH